ncbi:adenylate/guanylate cyclase domain-containing protein [Fulvivirga sp.]|uniref:adenylate/guanylate cyclase domain-containing protein n=1 Tax=Fulvivirga sp. TaxID=1931237 RepID=UPI0032EBE026
MKPEKFEYTTMAQRYTARYPLLTYLSIQVNFWIIANVLLALVISLYSRISSLIYGIHVMMELKSMLVMAVIAGIFYGVSYGLLAHYLERRFFRNLTLGKVILLKTLGSVVLLILLLLLLRHLFWNFYIDLASEKGTNLSNEIWDNVFYLLLVYYFFMAVLISYINQVNKKYGPGVLIPLLLGRYRHPREEDRIFMFMDLKSSTTYAEKLGHLKYSSFIRDYFDDINQLLLPFRAQVYQYVGDEIVVMWSEKEGLINNFCLMFFFACQQQFKTRADYYLNKYGIVPEFKAGLHSGRVSAVEIGEIKKDIAYHGDTINTTARIQSICNEHNKSFLISNYLLSKIELDPNIKIENIGNILLRGKSEKIEIASIEYIKNH